MDLIAAISRRRGESSMIDRVLDGRVMAPDHFDWRFVDGLDRRDFAAPGREFHD
jgi:hypothetical protein